MTFMEERYELSCERIEEIAGTQEVCDKYKDYFEKTAQFILLMKDVRRRLQDGFLQNASIEELRSMNHGMYEDILGANYDKSYANPIVCCEAFGVQMGRMLSFL